MIQEFDPPLKGKPDKDTWIFWKFFHFLNFLKVPLQKVSRLYGWLKADKASCTNASTTLITVDKI